MKSIVIVLVFFVAVSNGAPQFFENSAKILSQTFYILPDGQFSYNYETENFIKANAEGKLKVLKTDPYEDAEVIEGNFSWISPEGKTIFVEYVADELGYRPQIKIF